MAQYFREPMRRVSQAAVATGVAAAVSSSLASPDSHTIHAEEINDVARIIFAPTATIPTATSARPLVRVSSNPECHEALVKLGTRIASNPKIQALVQEEVGEWLLINTAPGGPPLPTLRTEMKDTASDSDSVSFSDSDNGCETPDSVRSEIAAELMKEIYSPIHNDSDERTVEPHPQSHAHPVLSSMPASPSASAPAPNSDGGANGTLLDRVFAWIMEKLDGVVGLFQSKSAASAPFAQSQSSAPVNNRGDDDNGSAPAPETGPTPSFTHAAVGIAAVLIVLVVCRRFSPALFKAAIRLL